MLKLPNNDLIQIYCQTRIRVSPNSYLDFIQAFQMKIIARLQCFILHNTHKSVAYQTQCCIFASKNISEEIAYLYRQCVVGRRDHCALCVGRRGSPGVGSVRPSIGGGKLMSLIPPPTGLPQEGLMRPRRLTWF